MLIFVSLHTIVFTVFVLIPRQTDVVSSNCLFSLLYQTLKYSLWCENKEQVTAKYQTLNYCFTFKTIFFRGYS